MSAQIPETMLLSDLLKPTGYDCPEELQGKTFEEATTGGDAKISTNTDKTVDVSTYTEPIEIEPAEGYDATKKVTLTLDNIPSGADIEANKAATIDVSTYTEPVEITPTEGKDGMAKATVTLSNIPSPGGSATMYCWKVQNTTSVLYTDFSTAPEALTNEQVLVLNSSTHVFEKMTMSDFAADEGTYQKDSDTQFSFMEGEDPSAIVIRDSSNDITLW